MEHDLDADQAVEIVREIIGPDFSYRTCVNKCCLFAYLECNDYMVCSVIIMTSPHGLVVATPLPDNPEVN